ncbi:MAG: hypothetical protein LC792_00040 [Actinobacteria bacterium]|nr:hypothetical protein [Actinomycetota bacterium]
MNQTEIKEAIAEQEEYVKRFRSCQQTMGQSHRYDTPAGKTWSRCTVCGVSETGQDYLRKLAEGTAAGRKSLQYLQVASGYGVPAQLVGGAVVCAALNGDTLTIEIEGNGPIRIVGQITTPAVPTPWPVKHTTFGQWFKDHRGAEE